MKDKNKKSKQRFASPKEKVVNDGARRKKLKPAPKQKYKRIDPEEDK